MTGIHFLRGQETPKRHSACGVSARYFVLLCFWCFPVIAQTLPDTPAPHTNKVWVAETAIIGALYATDWSKTSQGLDRQGRYETNPLLGHHPSNARITAYGASVFAGETLLLRRTEHSNRRWVRLAGRATWLASVAIEVRAIRTWNHR